MSIFGVVVVGVGRAGGARIRDIGNSHLYASAFPILNNVKLIGYVSRRADVVIEDRTKLDLDEALSRQDVHAVIITQENKQHEPLARRCLEAGKHVLVEFPLSLTGESVISLTNLAQEKGLKCCEEDIGLLTNDYKALQSYAASRQIESGSVTLEGSVEGWIGDWPSSGSQWHCSSNCMHTVLDICGDLTAVSAYAHYEPGRKSHAYATFKTQQGKLVDVNILRETREKPMRKKTVDFNFTDGTKYEPVNSPYVPPSPPNNPGLFMQDFIEFLDHVLNGVPRQPSDWLTLRAVQLADECQKLAKQNPKSTGLDF